MNPFLVYGVVALLIVFVGSVRAAAKPESAHAAPWIRGRARAQGTEAALLIGVLWPVALPLLAAVKIGHLAGSLFRKKG